MSVAFIPDSRNFPVQSLPPSSVSVFSPFDKGGFVSFQVEGCNSSIRTIPFNAVSTCETSYVFEKGDREVEITCKPAPNSFLSLSYKINFESRQSWPVNNLSSIRKLTVLVGETDPVRAYPHGQIRTQYNEFGYPKNRTYGKFYPPVIESALVSSTLFSCSFAGIGSVIEQDRRTGCLPSMFNSSH